MNTATLVKLLPVGDLVVKVFEDLMILTYPVTEFIKDPVTDFETLSIEGKVVDAMYSDGLVYLLTEESVKIYEINFYDSQLPEVELREVIAVNKNDLKLTKVFKGRGEVIVYGENEYGYTAFVIDLLSLEQKSFKTKEQATQIFIEEDKYVVFNHDSTVEIYDFNWELLECLEGYMRHGDVTKAVKLKDGYVLSVNSFSAEHSDDLFIIREDCFLEEILEINNTLDSDGNPTISSLEEMEKSEEVFFDDRVSNIVDIGVFEDRLFFAQHRDEVLYVFEVIDGKFTLIKVKEYAKDSKVSAHLHGNALLSITFEEGKQTLELESV